MWNLVIAILALIAIGLCVWVFYVRVIQHSQALMGLGKPDRVQSPYESAKEYEERDQ